MALLKCLHCKQEFKIKDFFARRGVGKVCSKECWSLWCCRPEVIVARFWGMVEIGTPDACWEWLGSIKRGGYGTFGYLTEQRGYVQTGAHRFAYTITKGEIPRGLLACHVCDNRSCCNPGHIFIGTYKDNKQDSVRKKRHAYGIYNGSAKVDDEEVERIFRLSFLGYSRLRIGKKFGLSQGQVGQILRRKLWLHVGIKNHLLTP